MKVCLIMASTPNGVIAKPDHDVSFVSERSQNAYRAAVRKAGNFVVGRTTYGLMLQGKEFDLLKGAFCVVVTKHPAQTAKISPNPRGNTIFVRSPIEALKELKKRGFNQALVIGGGALNASFLSAGLIDEIVIDVQPAILGQGVSLFAPGNYHSKLELLSAKRVGKGEVRLRYRVLSKRKRPV